MTKRKTNTALVRGIMEHSRYGALAQMFVIDALVKHADAVAKSTPSDYPENSWIHPEGWIGVAKEIKTALDEHLAPDAPREVRA
jgi:hypothetical protein